MKKWALVFTSVLFGFTTAHAAEDTKRPDFSQLCNGKAVNTKLTAKHDGRSIEGTCQIGFKANDKNALQRGAMRDPAVKDACKGKAKGTAINVKIDGKQVAGKCDVQFRPNMKA